MPNRPGDDTFFEITNAQIYKELRDQGERISKIESHLAWGQRFWAIAATSVTSASALIAAIYYVR
jgi:hypothetical protein